MRSVENEPLPPDDEEPGDNWPDDFDVGNPVGRL